MQTRLAPTYADTPIGLHAERLIAQCVHCGFCTATCPSYQLTGDELDSPRGRIYQIKRVLEGEPLTTRLGLHLDRCLTCRNCETTCPSGVRYAEIVDIGRRLVENGPPRPWRTRLLRSLLRRFLPSPFFAPALKLGQAMQPLLPRSLRQKLPQTKSTLPPWPQLRFDRHVLLPHGCVQDSIAPDIHLACAHFFATLGIGVTQSHSGCCGAIALHLGDHAAALEAMRRNIDAWYPRLINGDVEAIVIDASGCAATVHDYAQAFADDPIYRERAQVVSAALRDPCQYLDAYADRVGMIAANSQTPALHLPCTLQHVLRLGGVLEQGLQRLGFSLQKSRESHLCCGSAGTFSILQPAMATALRERKLAALQPQDESPIVSANIGCIQHLQSGSERPVRHWLEVVVALEQRSHQSTTTAAAVA